MALSFLAADEGAVGCHVLNLKTDAQLLTSLEI